jgi:hypothetical protein
LIQMMKEGVLSIRSGCNYAQKLLKTIPYWLC